MGNKLSYPKRIRKPREPKHWVLPRLMVNGESAVALLGRLVIYRLHRVPVEDRDLMATNNRKGWTVTHAEQDDLLLTSYFDRFAVRRIEVVSTPVWDEETQSWELRHRISGINLKGYDYKLDSKS
jgi:hypothetical protein